ncbi:MAG: transglutaminase domain-containing protein [Fuerstiella sp.]
MNRLSAERVSTQTDADRGVSALNSWVASCGAEQITDVQLDESAMIMLNNNPRVTAQRFTGSDGFYVRDCLLLRDLSNKIVSSIEFDQENSSREAARVIAIFQWVHRHVSLTEAESNSLPLNVFDILMLGKATAEHRAWLFAELLRQQQIDAVWVTTSAAARDSQPESIDQNADATEDDNSESAAAEETVAQDTAAQKTDIANTDASVTADESAPSEAPAPATAAKEADTGSIASRLLDSSNAMVVVLHENGAWLFDCQAGIPVPSGAKLNPIHPSPAGLDVLLAHSRWKSANVQLIAQAATFAPRMLILQDNLASSDAAVLYEELNGSASDIRPLLQRIEEGSQGAWSADQITMWPFPEEMTVASHALTEDQQQTYDQVMRFFDAPFERSVMKVSGGNLDTLDTDELTDEQKKILAEDKMRQNFESLMDQDTATSEDRFGKPSKKLLQARIQQISGSTDTTIIQQLQQVRIAGMENGVKVAVPKIYQEEAGYPPIIVLPLPSLIKAVNESSTGNSIYWAALCQFERGEIGSAIITLASYRRRQPDGQWQYPSLINEAMGQLIRNNKDRAIKALQQADQPDNPERLRAQLLLQALQTQNK